MMKITQRTCFPERRGKSRLVFLCARQLIACTIIVLALTLPGLTATLDVDTAAAPAENAFVLTIEDNLISLKAKDAPVLEIVKEIGRRMEIEVAGDIPAEEKVSMKFEKLTLDEAIGKLGIDYVYVTEGGVGVEKIAKLVLLPKGERGIAAGSTKPGSSPTEVMTVAKQEGERPAAATKPEGKEKADKPKTPQSEPFKFKFKRVWLILVDIIFAGSNRKSAI